MTDSEVDDGPMLGPTQLSKATEPTCSVVKLNGHSEHETAPGMSLYVPIGHNTYTVEDGGHLAPRGHSICCSAVGQYIPA
jgi:hypothetical protein